MTSPQLLPLVGFDRWAIETPVGFRLWLGGAGALRPPSEAEVSCALAITSGEEAAASEPYPLLRAQHLVFSVQGVQ